MTTRNTARTNGLLGHPADARLLFVNADDFGMCHAVNDAIIRSLAEGIVGSCSVMAPVAPGLSMPSHGCKKRPTFPSEFT